MALSVDEGRAVEVAAARRLSPLMILTGTLGGYEGAAEGGVCSWARRLVGWAVRRKTSSCRAACVWRADPSRYVHVLAILPTAEGIPVLPPHVLIVDTEEGRSGWRTGVW